MVEDKDSKHPQKDRLITILGPTASGKTKRAVSLARCLNGEIISGDSRQVYKNMDLGTGKDIEEYGEIPFHLIDIREAGEKYNLHHFVTDFHNSLNEIRKRGRCPILCGGSGMYVETVLSGVTLPEVPRNDELREKLKDCSLSQLTSMLEGYKTLHNTTDVDNPSRAIRAIEIEEFYKNNPDKAAVTDRKLAKPLDSIIIGIDIPREERRKRISQRLHQRLEAGMVKEVENLLALGIPPQDLIYYGLEYKFLTLYALGEISYSSMVHDLEIAIHQFAKRQMTWFRGMERRGFKINWMKFDIEDEEFIDSVTALIG